MPFIIVNQTITTIIILTAAAALAVFLYKLLRVIIDRTSYYSALKDYCRKNGGEIKKNNSLFKSFFRVYAGADIEMAVGGKKYGVKFFPKYLKNKNLLIESETKACLLKNTGVMGVSWRGSLPGVRTLAPDVIHEVIGRRIKINLTGAGQGGNVLIFSPECKRIYYVKKSERAEAYNGDKVFGYTVFYTKSALTDYLKQ